MRRLATILFLVGASYSLLGQQALVDNIDGQWFIHFDGQKTELPRSIHDLGNFDKDGLGYFMRHEKYGIVNAKGEIVVEEQFSSVKQLGGGYYLVLDSTRRKFIGDWHENQFRLRSVRFIVDLQPSWYRFFLDSSNILVNVNAEKEWELKMTDRIYESDFDHVQCSLDSTTYFFNPLGKEIECDVGYPLFGDQYLLIAGPTMKSVVYRDRQIQLPLDASTIRVLEDEITYSQSGKTTIISSYDGRVRSELPYEDISYYGGELIWVRNGGKMGLIRKNGEVVIPTEYSWISQQAGLYQVQNTNGAGILDKDGKMLVPCKYSYVVVYKDYFKVHNDLRMTGVISRKTGRKLLSCDYNRLVISDSLIRAFTNDMMRIIEVDTNHRITNDIVLSNVTSLVREQVPETYEVDERLYPLGWLKKNVPIYDSLGFEIGSKPKWGLKSANDSTLLPARYMQPIYVDQADFSLMVMPERDADLVGVGKIKSRQSRVVSHETGKQLIPEAIISIDTLDLLTRSYSRFYSPKGHGVLLGDNSILRVHYIDGRDLKYVRYCSSKKSQFQPADKTDYNAVKFPDGDMNNSPERTLKAKYKDKYYEYVKYENSEWNFLAKDGKKLFDEPFDFVHPFASETAIVQKKGYWGVVRADSFIIEPKYASVERSPISDTLLVVKKIKNGKRFLDTNGRVVTNGITRFIRSKGNLTQVEINKRKQLIQSNYEVISGDTRFQKLLDNDIFYSKEKKEYTIYDHTGELLGTVKLKPEEVWFRECVLSKTRGKKGVVSVDGDTLLPFEYKNISKLGKYIFAENGLNNSLFDQDMRMIDDVKSNGVLVDSISGNYAEILENKAIVYAPNAKKIASFKGTKFKHFHNGYLIRFGKSLHVFGPDQNLTFEFEPKELNVLGDNGYFVIGSDRVGHYFDAEWKEVSFNEPLTRGRTVGDGLVISRSKSGTILFGGDVKVVFESGTKAVGSFQNGFLLLERRGKYEFVDRKGINRFKRKFSEALPFSGQYATVREKAGWTIIDGAGHFQILPGFERIVPLSATLFSTSLQPVYGLFDAHGNELIPTEFQALNFINEEIIQGRKNGDIFYFDLNGKLLTLD
ncbi:MAG: WG repeat-containing protein [Crocinitomicaceae bacterium]